MSSVPPSALANRGRRNLFLRIARGADPAAPHRAPWKRLANLDTFGDEVLWAGWSGDGHIVMVGDEGRILHLDTRNGDTLGAASWRLMPSPARLPLHAVWGRSFDQLHAVGWMGTILRFDGEHWQAVRGGIIDEESGTYTACRENTPLFDLAGDDDGRLWAVGDDGLILAFDGQCWSEQESGVTTNLRGIDRSSSGTLWVVGADGTVLTSQGDGIWHALPCPVRAGFTSVLALGDDEVWMAGGRYFVDAAGFRGDLVRWHNGTFTQNKQARNMPRLRSLRPYREGILIAGDKGHMYYMQQQRIDRLFTDSQHDLMDIVVLPQGKAMAVGDYATVLAAAPDFDRVIHPETPSVVDSEKWQQHASGTEHNLWGMASAPDGTVYACGDGPVMLRRKPSGQWEAMPPPGEAAIHCLFHDGDTNLYAGNAMGQIHRFDGDSWELVYDLYLDITILGMWSDRSGALFAVGDEGLALHWDGTRWQRMITGTKSALYSIWGYDADHVLAVGDFGLVLRWNGTSWAEFYAGTDNFLFDVWGRSLTDIYIVGLSGTLSHFDGQRWTPMPVRARGDLTAIQGTAGGLIHAVGTQGAALYFDGDAWRNEATPATSGLRTLHITHRGEVYAAGNNGVILQRLAA